MQRHTITDHEAYEAITGDLVVASSTRDNKKLTYNVVHQFWTVTTHGLVWTTSDRVSAVQVYNEG